MVLAVVMQSDDAREQLKRMKGMTIGLRIVGDAKYWLRRDEASFSKVLKLISLIL